MRFNYIDAARGIAILLVMLVHTAQGLGTTGGIPSFLPEYGQMGVQLFFVASAFTLCLSHDRRNDEALPLLNYAIRRFFRIAPLYYAGIFGYFVLRTLEASLHAGSLVIPEDYSALNVLANVSFVHGFVPSANNTIVPGGWSIGTEMAFYTIFPLLFALFQGLLKRHPRLPLLPLALYLLAGVWAHAWFLELSGAAISPTSFIYYNLFNQLPVFLFGILYYGYWKQGAMKLGSTLQGLLLVGFTIAALWLWTLPGFSGQFFVVPVLSALSFVCLIEVLRLGLAARLPWLCRVGERSYSMYVLHFVFANLATGYAAAPVLRLLGPELGLLLCYGLTVLCSYALAGLSQRWLEAPGQALGRALIRRLASYSKP